VTDPRKPIAHPTGATPGESITSLSNSTVKMMRALERKKERQETGLFLAEGARLAEEGLLHGWRPAYVLVGQDALARGRTRDLVSRLEAAGARILQVNRKVLEGVSRKDNPQTLVSAFHMRSRSVSDLAADEGGRWVALYEVRDPGNLGTILRSADALGVRAVFLIGSCCDPFSTEAVRASMGSVFATPVVNCDFAALERWRREGCVRMLGASMHGAVRPDGASYGERSLILMGNEQSGLPASVEAECDQLVRIPMRGSADSLNLASASGIMMYEAWRAQNFEGAR